ncbi:MAG: BatD family protein [Candidatus Jettenia sp.]|nr:BatD family protein [Candidatus Jettenia sp.]
MVIVINRQHVLSSTLLIFIVFVYTLIPLKNAAFARESDNIGKLALPEATANVDKSEVMIGDKITLKVHVKYKDSIAVQFPEFDQPIGVFTVKGSGVVEGPRKDRDGYSLVERSYILSSYEIGRATIPSLKINYKGAQGEGEVTTNEVTIDIKGVIKEEETVTDIKDIIPPIEIPTNYKRFMYWVFVGLGGLFIAGILYGFFHKMKKRQTTQEQEYRKRTPHEVAYELLERLLKEDLVGKGLTKEYYYRITDILRHYIEDRFGLLAPERTTEEFLAEMAHTNRLEESHKILIQEFLEHADMVKYAKYGPSNVEVKEAYDRAKRLVDETKERLEEEVVI